MLYLLIENAELRIIFIRGKGNKRFETEDCTLFTNHCPP